MPLAARVAHARLLLVAARFSCEISGPPMVGSGRSEVEDSVGGGLDGVPVPLKDVNRWILDETIGWL